jgi:hypothetical protein
MSSCHRPERYLNELPFPFFHGSRSISEQLYLVHTMIQVRSLSQLPRHRTSWLTAGILSSKWLTANDVEDLLTDNNSSRSSETEPLILLESGPQQSRWPRHAGVVPKFAPRMFHSETYFKRMAAMVSSSPVSSMTVSQWLI